MKTPARKPWTVRETALLLLMLAVAVWVHRQPLMDIVAISLRQAEQSHIFLVPLVAGWLVWLRRSRFRFISYRPSVLGIVFAVAGWIISWWGFADGTHVAWHGGALLTLFGVVISVTGWELVRQFAPAIIVLAFLVPVPGVVRQEIAIPLQKMATSITHASLEMFGVAATRDGNVLIINGEEVAVGEACNGMRMVFALTLVVYAFAFGTPLRWSTRIVLLILSPITALICNVIRLVPTSLVYGYASSRTAELFHDAAGWIMLPIALFLLLGVLRTFKWLEIPVKSFRLAQQ